MTRILCPDPCFSLMGMVSGSVFFAPCGLSCNQAQSVILFFSLACSVRVDLLLAKAQLLFFSSLFFYFCLGLRVGQIPAQVCCYFHFSSSISLQIWPNFPFSPSLAAAQRVGRDWGWPSWGLFFLFIWAVFLVHLCLYMLGWVLSVWARLACGPSSYSSLLLFFYDRLG